MRSRSRQKNPQMPSMFMDPFSQQSAIPMYSQPSNNRNQGDSFTRNPFPFDHQNRGIIPRTRAPSSQGRLNLFNRTKPARGGITSLIQPSSISGFLQNTNQFLQTIQQFTPLVQQYGPMVRNIPMMWKLYQGFKNIDTDEETTNHQEEVKEGLTESNSPTIEHDTSPKNKPIHSGDSVPKLFFPHE